MISFERPEHGHAANAKRRKGKAGCCEDTRRFGEAVRFRAGEKIGEVDGDEA